MKLIVVALLLVGTAHAGQNLGHTCNKASPRYDDCVQDQYEQFFYEVGMDMYRQGKGPRPERCYAVARDYRQCVADRTKIWAAWRARR